MCYQSKEALEAGLKLKIKLWRETIEIMPEVKKIVNQFDGKQVNKRFADAMMKINPRIYASVGKRSTYSDKNSISIELRAAEHSYGNYVTVLYIHDIAVCTSDNKKLDAAAVIEALDKRAAEYKVKADQAAFGLAQIEIYRAEIEKLKGYADFINNMIPDEIKMNLNMHVRVNEY